MQLLARHSARGVDVFFVISGFLITLLLFREQERTGRISLKGFYSRRALRILPAYLCFLSFVAILVAAGFARLRPIDWAISLTYTTNLVTGEVAREFTGAAWSQAGADHLRARWYLSHTWSLSVEEHFYLLWPAALIIMGRFSARTLLLLILLGSPLIRWLIWTYLRRWLDIDFATPARLDTIAAGCLLAYFVTDPRGQAFMRRLGGLTGPVLVASICLIALSAWVGSMSGKYSITVLRSVEAVAISFGVLALVSNPRSLPGRILETKALVFVGVLSYSIYLWQQPFFNPHSSQWICRWPQNLILALVAATASHVFVERPFLRLKDRTRRASLQQEPKSEVHLAGATLTI